VQVVVTSPSLIGGPRATTTDAEGRYRLAALEAGEYEVRMTRSGFASAIYPHVQLAAGGSVEVDGVADVSAVSEHVDVTAPSIDVRSSASVQEIDDSLLGHLPTSRDLASLINLTPGVSQDVGFGGTKASNALWVDGVDITGAASQNAAAHFSYNWLDGMQVLAPGAGAEYGQFTGVGATYALRSGSNHLSGLFEVLNTPSSWVGSNTPNSSSLDILSSWDTSAQLGGPLAEDRAWFFFGYHYALQDEQPAGYDGPGSTRSALPEAIVKLTASPGHTVRLDGFVQHGHPTVSARELGPFRELAASQDISQPQTAWNLRATWIPGSRDVVDIRTGGYRREDHLDPHPPSSRSGPYPHIDEVTGVATQNIDSYEHDDSVQQTLAMAWTRYVNGRGGLSHELKAGLEYEHSRLQEAQLIPGGQLFTDDDGVPTYVQIWPGEIKRASTNRTSLYVQDNWQAASALTINAGVRLDMNRGAIPVHGTLLSTNPIAPRVGVAWDVTSRHRTVLRAHYGRYYEANLASWVQQSDHTLSAPEYFYAINGPDDYEFLSVLDPGSWRSFIDPALKQAYVDQYSVGAEHDVVAGVTAEVQFIRRNCDRVFGIFSEGSVWSPVSVVDPGPDGIFGTSDDGGPLTVYSKKAPGEQVLTNPEGATRHYNGLQFIARKRYDKRWEMQASYTWSRTYGNVSNQFQTNIGHLGLQGDYGDPNRQINANGPAPLDFANSVKLLGTYTLPWLGGLNLSGVYRFDSGSTWERTDFFRVPGGRAIVRAEPRGSRRLPPSSTIDLRADKTFRLGRSGTISGFVEAFNLTNRGVPTAVYSGSGPDLGLPATWSDPRTGRIGARWMF
jgi:hypothetical protein